MSVNPVSKNMVSEDNVKRRKIECNPKIAMVTNLFLTHWRLIEKYLSPATTIKAASLLSNRFSAALKPAKDKVVQIPKMYVQAALEKPQFKSVLTESDKKKSPVQQVEKLAAYAKKKCYLINMKLLSKSIPQFYNQSM